MAKAKTQSRYKFKPTKDEPSLRRGNFLYASGDGGASVFSPTSARSSLMTVFLTPRRVVVTKVRQFFPWGPLVWLIMALLSRRVVTAIPLDQLASIRLGSGGTKYFTLSTMDGRQYSFNPATLLLKRDAWVAAISDAVSQLCPGTVAQQEEGLITFIPAS